MLSPTTRRNLSRVIPFGILWFLFSLLYTVLEKSLLGNLPYYPATGLEYQFSRNILTIPVAGLIMGLLTGILEIKYFHNRFNKSSFSRKIVIKSIVYLVILVLFLIVIVFVNTLFTQDVQSFKRLPSPLWSFFRSFAMIGILLYIGFVVVLTQFYAEFREGMGLSTLNNFFLGKYHHPIQEERVFMFVDMRSSTTIAEDLGHVRYFEMLKSYFSDLSGAVIAHGGAIYQYAGDEMIVCWKLKSGMINNKSVECFFAMKQALKIQADKYHARFGLLPEFKAGLHCGKVTTGEIGSLKKEIIFTGDVLNTTARIQGLCNNFGADLLVSEDLVNLLRLSSKYQVSSVGETSLRGRRVPMKVFAISIL